MALLGITTRAGQLWPTHLPGLLGPAISAVVVTGAALGLLFGLMLSDVPLGAISVAVGAVVGFFVGGFGGCMDRPAGIVWAMDSMKTICGL